MAGFSSNPMRVLLIATLCAVAYAPAFNNGFIADDFDNLMTAREFRSDPSCLFSIPPQNFRIPTFIMLVDFPYPYPVIAKAVSQFRQGWTPDLIRVEGADPT